MLSLRLRDSCVFFLKKVSQKLVRTNVMHYFSRAIRHKQKHDKMTQVSENQAVNSRTREGRIITIKAQIQAMTEIYGCNNIRVIQLRIKLANIQ